MAGSVFSHKQCKFANTEMFAKLSNQRLRFSDNRTDAIVWEIVHDDWNKAGNNF